MGQLQVLRGKVQEAKPVFAVVEPATVPLAPASPKKMLIIIAFAFLAFVLESAWILFGTYSEAYPFTFRQLIRV